ncbi:MAG TPA: sigma-70 family RNA polymerase sigma factor [Anaerolineales bacterium]|nr:sigma-70 family RNA polymerase sigma factor [Anaerolineales bacterium]
MQTANLAKSLISWATETTQPPMTQPADDLDLIRRLKTGDDDAVRDLYRRYGQRLYAYALRITNDSDTAEDVTQSTLITAWRTAQTFRGEGRLIAWLLGIVHHTAMKALRNSPYSLDQDTEETVPDPQLSPEEQAQGRETKQWVRRGLQNLSPEHRAVLELVFYQGLSLNEVAEVLGCPLGTVKSRLSYARQHLRGVLARTEESWR